MTVSHEQVVGVRAALEEARPLVERISAEVWQLSELSLEEVESAHVHVRELDAAGSS